MPDSKRSIYRSPHSQLFTIRFSNDQWNTIRVRAIKAGLSEGEYIKRVLFRKH